MPIVSTFFGMVIRIFHADHNPPHFHVQYGEMKAIFEIRTGKTLEGKLPLRLIRLVNEWRRLHQTELEAAWSDAQNFKSPRRIKPLE